MSEQMAMIEEVGVGSRDVGYPVLWFTVSGDGWGALQVMNLTDDKATEILSSVRDIRDLNGRTCMVEKENGIVRFSRLLHAPRIKP